MEENVVIQVEGLRKKYRIGQIGSGTLARDLQSWWAKARHKEDPNRKIGYDVRLIGEDFWALNGIDLSIKKGEVVGIVGANGSGKSTFLKILSRVTAPTEGRVLLRGRIASMLEVGTGFNPEMTGRENIYMNGAILGMTQAEVDQKVESIIDFSECREFIDTPVKRYSSGMYVRLAFAVAAHLDSDILVMDEVLAVGDMKFQQKCLNKMGSVAETEGRTVLYVSHNMGTVRQLCSRCVVLAEGKTVFDGDVESGIAHYFNNVIELVNDISTEEIPRSPKLVQKAVITRIEALEKEHVLYSVGEAVALRVTWRALEDIQDACLRVIVRRFDGSPVGSSFSDGILSARSGETHSLCVDMDFGVLAPGRYSMTFALSKISDGAIVTFDLVVPNFYFEVVPHNEVDLLRWDGKNWGDIHFNNFVIREVRQEKL